MRGSGLGRRGTRLGTRLGIALVVTALVAAGCSSGDGDDDAPPSDVPAGEVTGQVTIYGYEDVILPEVLGPFEEENPGIEVRAANFSDNDEAVAKLQGGFEADVINSCTEETARLVAQGLIQPIDTSRIEAWDSLFPQIRDLSGIAIDGEVYMIPNVGGTSGIIYNPEEAGEVTSYAQLLEDPALEGKITLGDSPQETIPLAALALGHTDPYALDDADLQEIQDYLIEHKGQVRTLFKGDADFLNLYRTGEIVAGFGYHDYVAAMNDENIPVAMSPGEGSMAWVCGMSLGADVAEENLDAAYAALNYYASPVAQSFYAEEYNYVVSNQETLEELDPQLVKDLRLDQPEQLDSAIALQIPDNYDQWLEVWRAYKAA
ncbi:MAG: extracellular solute-binding protein [Actinomycetota bacterium]